MAFNYSEATNIKSRIAQEAGNLDRVFKDFENLMNESLNNKQIWYGTSSADFKKNWDAFAGESYNTTKRQFEQEINVIGGAIENYRQSEQMQG